MGRKHKTAGRGQHLISKARSEPDPGGRVGRGEPCTPGSSVPSTSGSSEPSTSGSSAPSTSGISRPSTSGISRPSTSGISRPSTSGISRPSTSGISGPSTSGISGPSTSGSSHGRPERPERDYPHSSRGAYHAGSYGSESDSEDEESVRESLGRGQFLTQLVKHTQIKGSKGQGEKRAYAKDSSEKKGKYKPETESEKERKTETERKKETDRKRETDKKRETDRKMETDRKRETDRKVETKAQTQTQMERVREVETEFKPPVVRMGVSGQNVMMHCNYIALRTTPGKGIFEYEVRFDPHVVNMRTRYRLIYKHLPLKKGIQCYDGVHKLFLPEARTEKLVVQGECPNEKTPITITVTFKRKVRTEECGTFYNVLLNNCAKVLNLTRLGRHHYDSKANLYIPQHKLEVWPGYVTSVEEYEGGIHLCCDVRHRILRTDTAYDILNQVYRSDPCNFKNKAAKELLGQCILTRYNNHMYRIDDIAWNESPLSTFSAKGKEISYVDYYKAQYNINIRDLRQPLLIHIPKMKSQCPQICLIPELSHMTGLTDAMRRDMKVMKEVATYTRITPPQREYSLRKFVESIHNNTAAQEMLNNWGLEICRNPVTLTGRVLPPEEMFFRNDRTESSESSDWLKYIRKQGVLRSVDMVNWVMLFTARDKILAETFLRTLQETGPGLGIRIAEPTKVVLRDDRIESYIKGLKDNIRPKTQIVLCVCTTPREDRYSAIKKLCCVEMPVPSQVINCGTISRQNRLRMVAQNVLLQMNNKIGGASWALNVPLKNCMVCGIDTYHDTEKKGNSVGAFVASIDSRYTHWFSQVCVQEPKQELLHGLVVCFAAALQKYHSVNKKLPDRIVIFRDGVSDGHLKYIEEIEIQQFLQACKLAEDYTPKFSYIVVQKRINTKFYLQQGPQLENPTPGSILDNTITRRNFYDFFLVSQHVSCGTATPSHYIVLFDNSDLKPDYMQRLTYKFCHMYYNWPGTIRVPAPCQYAHKLAFLVGQNIKKQYDGLLRDKLFYL